MVSGSSRQWFIGGGASRVDECYPPTRPFPRGRTSDVHADVQQLIDWMAVECAVDLQPRRVRTDLSGNGAMRPDEVGRCQPCGVAPKGSAKQPLNDSVADL